MYFPIPVRCFAVAQTPAQIAEELEIEVKLLFRVQQSVPKSLGDMHQGKRLWHQMTPTSFAVTDYEVL